MPEQDDAPRRLVIGPFNRVEGDLEVSLEVEEGRVAKASVCASLYRGFEQLLVGRVPQDALVLVPRICGICSVSQSVAAARTLASLGSSTMPPNGQRAANLILATEVLADHLTHFYLFFMPDFAHAAYAGQPWHAHAAARFQALKGSASADFLPARAGLLRVLALLAGKWPHTLALRPEGVTRALQRGDRMRLRLFLGEFRAFVERVLFGDRLEAVADVDTWPALMQWSRGRNSDFANFLQWSEALDLHGIGRASDLFIATGAYADDRGQLFPPGVWDGGLNAFDPERIAEDAHHTWLMDHGTALAPNVGVTEPQADKTDAYSWCKAPRYAGRVGETGALARQVVAGHGLALDMVSRSGGSITARVVARMIEVARVLLAMERWIAELVDDAPYMSAAVTLPLNGNGVGFVEAARGALGHWLTVSEGRVARYQIVAPTTWNFSPRDRSELPGPLEQALTGLPVGEDGSRSVLVQHVVRSFDPCMACTVH